MAKKRKNKEKKGEKNLLDLETTSENHYNKHEIENRVG